VATARRGGALSALVVNTWPLERLLAKPPGWSRG
jgi:hypothetical protein